MKKPLRSIACLLLLAALTVTLFSACTGDTAPTSSQPDADSTPADQSQTGDPANHDILPEVKDMNGREFRVYCFDFGASSAGTITGYTGEILYSTEENATSVDIEKKAVIDQIEAQYNCKITGSKESNQDTFRSTVSNMVTTGTYEYDILFNASAWYTSLFNNDLLTDLNTISTLHLSNSWWDQNAVEQLSIANRLFYVCGDINTYDDLGTWCVLFNKNLKERLGIQEDFYQLAENGQWTLDKFMEICQGISADTNGDGVHDEFDRWALGTERYNIFVQVLGGGLHAVEKDSQTDLPYITVAKSTAQTYSALDKIIQFYQTDAVLVADIPEYAAKYPNGPWAPTVNKAFQDGRELFYMCGLINVAAFRSMDDHFGILPIPKTFAEQDRYYHTVSTTNSSYLSIPYGAPGTEDLGIIIEAIACESQKRVTPAFYDIQLKYRDFKDDESARMLDLIFSTRSFDLGPIFNWGNLMSSYYASVDLNYASRFDTYLTAAELALEQTVEQVQNYLE